MLWEKGGLPRVAETKKMGLTGTGGVLRTRVGGGAKESGWGCKGEVYQDENCARTID